MNETERTHTTGGGDAGEELARLRALLLERDETRAWLEGLDRLGRPAFDAALPPAGELLPVLLALAVPHEDIDALPRGTALQRALIDHLKAGRQWSGGVGWLRL